MKEINITNDILTREEFARFLTDQISPLMLIKSKGKIAIDVLSDLRTRLKDYLYVNLEEPLLTNNTPDLNASLREITDFEFTKRFSLVYKDEVFTFLVEGKVIFRKHKNTIYPFLVG